MKRIASAASAVLPVLASIGGCAPLPPNTASDRGIDLQKVSAVDHAARTRNLEVHWVNYPTRKATDPSVAPASGTATGT